MAERGGHRLHHPQRRLEGPAAPRQGGQPQQRAACRPAASSCSSSTPTRSPTPEILERTLGYFRDDDVALVQTPQWFFNVPAARPVRQPGAALLRADPAGQGRLERRVLLRLERRLAARGADAARASSATSARSEVGGPARAAHGGKVLRRVRGGAAGARATASLSCRREAAGGARRRPRRHRRGPHAARGRPMSSSRAVDRIGRDARAPRPGRHPRRPRRVAAGCDRHRRRDAACAVVDDDSLDALAVTRPARRSRPSRRCAPAAPTSTSTATTRRSR